MRGVPVSVAAAIFAAANFTSGCGAKAAENGRERPTILFFTGADGWRMSAFGYAGFLWSPGGLDNAGFTLKVVGSGGTYRYLSGALGGVEVTGRQWYAAAMPGWRFKNDNLVVTVFLGPDWQDTRLTPDDPGNRSRGRHFGASAGIDVWYQPIPEVMVAANGSATDRGDFSLRAAAGGRFLDRGFVGPEAQVYGGDSYWQIRFGLQATGFKIGPFEWSLGAGWAQDDDDRNGVYGYLGLNARR